MSARHPSFEASLGKPMQDAAANPGIVAKAFCRGRKAILHATLTLASTSHTLRSRFNFIGQRPTDGYAGEK